MTGVALVGHAVKRTRPTFGGLSPLYAQHIGANKKFGRVCRAYVAWSCRRPLAPVEITCEYLATYAT